MIKPSKLQTLFPHQHYVRDVLDCEDVFFVGGAVRDLLLGVIDNPTDIDLTTASTPDKIWSEMREEDLSRFKTDKFGTITFLPANQKTVQYELTPLRTEGGYGDFRHPEEITWSNDLLADSNRRDFTINAIYWYGIDLAEAGEITLPEVEEEIAHDQLATLLEEGESIALIDQQTVVLQDPQLIKQLFAKGKYRRSACEAVFSELTPVRLGSDETPSGTHRSILLDPHQGVLNILRRTLRAVGDPHQRFGEDALRIIRGPRFVNVLNQKIVNKTDSEQFFDFDNATWDAMQKNYYLVSYIAKERIKTELEKVFKAPDPFGFVSMLDELRLLGILFPGVANTKQVEQPIRYHPFDVYNHTILTLNALQQINTDWLTRLGMLYHDVGKPEQYHFFSLNLDKQEKKLPVAGQMYHTNLGVEIAERDFTQLGFSKKEIEIITRYVKRHHRPGEILDSKPENRPKKLRKLISEVGHTRVLHLIDIAIADRLGMYNPMQPPAVKELKKLKQLVRKIYKEEGRFTMSEMAIDGHAIMKKFDLTEGPAVGKLLKKAFNRVMDDTKERNNKEKIIEFLENENTESDSEQHTEKDDDNDE